MLLDRVVTLAVSNLAADRWLREGCAQLGWTPLPSVTLQEATAAETGVVIGDSLDWYAGRLPYLGLTVTGAAAMSELQRSPMTWTWTAKLTDHSSEPPSPFFQVPDGADACYIPLYRFLEQAKFDWDLPRPPWGGRPGAIEHRSLRWKPLLSGSALDAPPVAALHSRSTTESPTPSADASPRLFVSYRRADNAFAAGRLRDELARHFGADDVFFDTDSIPPGADFREVIRSFIADVTGMVVVIGPDWQPERLADPTDFVRMELLEARRQGKLIVPVVLDDTRPPAPSLLPNELEWLAFLNAVKVASDNRFRTDVERIAVAIRRAHDA